MIVHCAEEIPSLYGDAKLLDQVLLKMIPNASQAGARTVRIETC